MGAKLKINIEKGIYRMKSSHASDFVSESSSDDDVQMIRLENLLRVTNAGSFGSLYKVFEAIWKSSLTPTYDQKNTRRSHPGCSVRAENASINAYVPMLHGSSSKPKHALSVLIADVYGEPHKTYFGGLDPVPIPIRMRKFVEVAEKGRVTPEEGKALRNLCQQRKWL